MQSSDLSAKVLRPGFSYLSDTRIANSLLIALLAVGVSYVVTVRVRLAMELPLWLDESFTLTIISAPTFSSFLRELHADPAAPLYYILMRLMPGESNFALRLPGLVFMAGASVLPLIWRVPRLPLFVAACWGGLLFFWNSGVAYSADARPYALLMLLSTAQTIAFARLLERPKLKIALAWTTLAALSIVCHYLAGAFGFAQGIILLAVHRQRALRLWPAVVPLLLPAFILLWHWPRLLVFATPGVAWYQVLSAVGAFAIGFEQLGPLWMIVAAVAIVSRLLTPRAIFPKMAAIGAVAGVASIVILLVVGMITPSITPRYLTPGIPGAFLLLLLYARNRQGQLCLVALFLVSSTTAETSLFLKERATFGMEMPTHLLIRDGPPTRVVFSLGFAGQYVLQTHTMAQLGSSDFRRHGYATVATLVPTLGGAQLEREAGRSAAIIWLFANAQAAEARALMQRRRCFHLVGPWGGTLACPALERPKT